MYIYEFQMLFLFHSALGCTTKQ